MRWGGRLRISLAAIREFQEARAVRMPDPAETARRVKRRSRRDVA